MDDVVMAGEDDCRAGGEYDQNGHELPIRSPLESEGASGRRGSSDDGDGGESARIASEKPSALINKGTRNDAVTKRAAGAGTKLEGRPAVLTVRFTCTYSVVLVSAWKDTDR